VGRQAWYLTREDLTAHGRAGIQAEGFELRFATRADLPAMEGFRRRVTRETLERWCGPGYFFFIALAAGAPVSYRCLSPLVHPGVAGFIAPGPDQIFMVDEFTVPEFRRRGLTRHLAGAMTPFLLPHGYREVLGIHRTDNHDTIAAVKAKQIPRVGTIIRWRFLWWTWFRLLPGEGGAPPAVRLAGDLAHSDEPLPEVTGDARRDPWTERVEPAQAGARLWPEGPSRGQSRREPAHRVADPPPVGPELPGPGCGKRHEAQIARDGAQDTGDAVVPGGHPHGVAGERVIDTP
jgi:GNAT superfamily N-acetyltransferase